MQAAPPPPPVFPHPPDRFPSSSLPASSLSGPSKPRSPPAPPKPPTPSSALSPPSRSSSRSSRHFVDLKSPPSPKKQNASPAPVLSVSPHPSSPPSPKPSAETPARLAQLLANALSELDVYKNKYQRALERANRAERMLASAHSSSSSSSQRGQTGINAKSVSEIESIRQVKQELDSERTERSRDELAQILHSLIAQFAELDRFEASCEQSLQDARSNFRHTLSNYAAKYPRDFSNPPAASPNASVIPRVTLPPLPAPPNESRERQAPTSSSFFPTHSAASSFHPNGVPSGSQSTFKPSASSQSFQSLPLPPPPVASGLSAYASSMVPAKRAYRNRSEREDGVDFHGINGQLQRTSGQNWEEQKRRKTGAWDGDADKVYKPMQRTSTFDRPTSQLPYSHGVDAGRPLPSSGSANSLPPTPVGVDYEYRGRPRYTEQDTRIHQHERDSESPQARRDMGRVDARELVRGAKERARYGVGAPLYTYAPQSLESSARDASTRRRRSSSRSSAASSWSIDEMILHSATDKRGREDRDIRAIQGIPREATYPSYAPNGTSYQGTPQDRVPQKSSSVHTINYSVRPNGSTTDANPTDINSNSTSTNGKVPARQLMTFGPGGTVVSGGGRSMSNLSIPGGGFPPQNELGQRICRQCGVPGREKDGKCVEKWGPGPEGPGTVCDRCRKKMKRVERRGALESASASQHALLAHRNSISHQVQPYSEHPASVSHSHAAPRIHAQDTMSMHANKGRTASRQDTLIIDAHDHVPQQQHERNFYRDRDIESDRDSRAESRRSTSTSRYHNHRPLSPAEPPVSRDHRSSHYTDGHQSPSVAREQATLQLHSSGSNRRPPTPPYITSISTHEQQFANGKPSSNSYSHARPTLSATRSAPRGGHDGRATTEEFVDGEDEDEDDGDGDEDDLDLDTEIARAAGSGKSSRSFVNGANTSRAATLDDRDTSSQWSRDIGSAHPERNQDLSRLDNQSRDQDQDELDSDMDGDVELDASLSGSRSVSRPRSTHGLDRGGKDAVAKPDSDEAVMKTED